MLLTLGLFVACTTDPIIPPDGLAQVNDPVTGDSTLVDPIQEPVDSNACDPGVISFQYQVLPILVSACAYSGCHDAASHKEGVVLDSYDRIIREVRAGDASRSGIYRSIIRTSGEEAMPPPPAPRLTSTQISIIKDWINQGAEETDCGAPCDPTASSFQADIYPILKDYCVGCHSSTRSDGNVKLETYTDIISYANSGTLMGAIRHDPYYAAMPPNSTKLSECKIAQIEKWIEEGAKNN